MPSIENLRLTIYPVYSYSRHHTTNLLIADSTPMLRSLVLTKPENSLCRMRDPLPVCAKILYGEAAPQLQKLKMLSIDFQWHLGFRHPNMRDLRILLAPTVSSTPVKSITAVLNAMPLLEVLILKNCLSKDMRLLQSGDKVVTLRHLRSIAIAGSSFDCANLLTHIDFPSDASLKLGCHGAQSPSFITLQIYMTRFIESFPLQHLTVTNDMSTFRFAPIAESPESVDADFRNLNDIRMLPEFIMCFRYHTLLTVCENLLLTSVVGLTIIGPYQEVFKADRAETLTNAFVKMPNVRVLHARNMPTRSPLHQKSAEIQSPVSIEYPNSEVLPDLQELKLEYALLEANHAERLIAYLKKRQDHELGLEQVTIYRSLIPEEQRSIIMPHLQELVSDGDMGSIRSSRLLE